MAESLTPQPMVPCPARSARAVRFFLFAQICQQCTGLPGEMDVACVSLDCSVYYERVRALRRLIAARVLLDALPDPA